MTALRLRPARQWLADRVETIFGADPGLVRLRTSARAVISAMVTIGLAVALFGDDMQTAPAFAAGFMLSVFGNVAVPDGSIPAKSITLALLVVTITLAIGASGELAAHHWLADGLVLVVCVGASMAKMAGPRAMVLGMVAFIGSFMGDVLHAAPAVLPEVFATAAIAAVIVAVLRFWLMRDEPTALLERVRRHLDRRVSRIIEVVRDLIASNAHTGSSDVDERDESRLHRELGRLNDAFLVAQNELTGGRQKPDKKSHLSWDRFFALELAAERLVRVARDQGDAASNERACARLDDLNQALINNCPLPRRSYDLDGPLLRSIDALIAALDRGDQTGPSIHQTEPEIFD
jgi:hypothetical protein